MEIKTIEASSVKDLDELANKLIREGWAPLYNIGTAYRSGSLGGTSYYFQQYVRYNK